LFPVAPLLGPDAGLVQDFVARFGEGLVEGRERCLAALGDPRLDLLERRRSAPALGRVVGHRAPQVGNNPLDQGMMGGALDLLAIPWQTPPKPRGQGVERGGVLPPRVSQRAIDLLQAHLALTRRTQAPAQSLELARVPAARLPRQLALPYVEDRGQPARGDAGAVP